MKILAVDYGDARTGLAVCDAGELLARPVTVIHSHKMEEVLTRRLPPPEARGPGASSSATRSI